MLIGGPHFLPLVELLPLDSFPPTLPLFENKCHIPAISYLLCWQPHWPVEDTPLQPVHSRRMPVYIALIGSALCCPCDPPPAIYLAPSSPSFPSLFLFYTSILSWPLSLCSPSVVLHSHNPPLLNSLKHPQLDCWGGVGAAVLKPRQWGCKSVMVFTGLP